MKKNIAHVFLTLNMGGMEKVGLDLIRGLGTEKYNHYIICLNCLGVLGEQVENEEGVWIKSLDKSPGFSFKVLLQLYRIFKSHGIDVVHTNNPAPHFWGGIAAWFARVPARIHTKHGRNFIHMRRRVILNRWSALFSTKVVCVSEDSARLTRTLERVRPSKVSVITNGVDTERFSPGDRQESLLAELGLSLSDCLIGSIARFSTDKDQATLVRAFAGLIQRGLGGVKLLLVGDGETLCSVKALVSSLDLDDLVVFTGARHDIPELLRLLDVYVLATHTEGISVALLEAMSTKVVCIASDVGGNSEIIDDGIDGFLVPEEDDLEMSKTLELILSDPQLKASIASNAHGKVISEFSLASVVGKYEILYGESI